MGKAQRNKGRRGETAAKQLLQDRDYTILADTSAGVSQADVIAMDELGTVFAVEVKNTASINVAAYRKQAIAQAGRMNWMLMCKIAGTNCWLVMGKHRNTTVWEEKGNGNTEDG